MTKCDPKFSSQGIQTDSCLSDTLFASKSDLDNLKAELLYKMTEIRSEMNALNSVPSLSKSGPLSSNHPQVVQLSSIHHPPADKVIYGSMTKVTFETKFKNCCMSYTIKSPMELNYMLFLTRKYLSYLDKYSGCVA